GALPQHQHRRIRPGPELGLRRDDEGRPEGGGGARGPLPPGRRLLSEGRLLKTPPPNPLPEAERGRKTAPTARSGREEQEQVVPVLLPLSASGRGLGGGVGTQFEKGERSVHGTGQPAAQGGARRSGRANGPRLGSGESGS